MPDRLSPRCLGRGGGQSRRLSTGHRRHETGRGDGSNHGRFCIKDGTLAEAKFPLFVTSNRQKIVEASEILGFSVAQIDLPLPEIQAVVLEPVVRHKLVEAYRQIRQPVIVEDTGLFIEAWGGLPGALVDWFLQKLGNEGICRLLQAENNRQARAQSAIGFYNGQILTIAIGEVRGEIAPSPRGEHGFGWDPLFIPEGESRTFGEMSSMEKHRFSMRRQALEKLHTFLQGVVI
ncbi:MAG: non-canonical purine NTP pyrophosphatase, RdgB/HAM1 family [Nitrospinota bacterium]|nr:MAG: non-canonical purine NTP pyrophosphatase, RdgB/HAM1 family [Nitrospinota bacterium]